MDYTKDPSQPQVGAWFSAGGRSSTPDGAMMDYTNNPNPPQPLGWMRGNGQRRPVNYNYGMTDVF